MLKLNLGCGLDHKPGYLNVDQVEPADLIVDLAGHWPFDDSSVDEIFAHGVFQCLKKIHAMNEAWRVLKPGGILNLAVPCIHRIGGNVNPAAFANPAHVSYWTLEDCGYYPEERGRLEIARGIEAQFRVRSWSLGEDVSMRTRRLGNRILGQLEAVK